MSTFDREDVDIPDDEIKESISYLSQCSGGDEYNGLRIMCDQLMGHPVLSVEEERRLLEVIKNGCDDEQKLNARNTLLLYNQRFVFNIAKKYRYKGCLTVEDLIQEGTIGLMKAIEHFELSKDAKFSTYAFWWVRQAIKRAIEETADVIRKPGSTHSLYKRLQRMREQLKRFTNDEPTDEDLAEASGLSVKRVKEILLGMELTSHSSSLDKPLYYDEDEAESILSKIPDGSAAPAEIVSEKVFNEQLEALIASSFDDREAHIIKRRFGLFDDDEQVLEDIGKELGISRERVRQIVGDVVNKIKTNADFENSVDAADSDSLLIEALLKLTKSRKALEAKRKHCLVCGKKLPAGHWRYCGERCRKEVISKNGITNITQKKCVVCGSRIPLRRRKYCGDKCKSKARVEREKQREEGSPVSASIKANQLMLFDVADYATSRANRKAKRYRRQGLDKAEMNSIQLNMWQDI